VAVNPYLGLVDRHFEHAARLLAHTSGAHTTLDAAAYLEAVEQGR